MTLQELSQLYYLKREIAQDRERLRRLEPDGDSAAVLFRLIGQKRQRLIRERVRLEEFIQGIEDSATRQIFSLRFGEGLSWLQVALRVGGGNTEDGVKKACYRYLRKCG